MWFWGKQRAMWLRTWRIWSAEPSTRIPSNKVTNETVNCTQLPMLIYQTATIAVLMKYKKLSMLFHVGMNVGGTAEKITSQDICDYNLPLSTVYMLNRWSLYHPSSRYLYLFGGNTWSLKTFYSKHCLLPMIFVLTFSSLDLEFIYPAVSSCSLHLQRCFWCYEEKHTRIIESGIFLFLLESG